jgi:hypothetical protein
MMERSRKTESEMHTSEKSSRWRIYRTKPRENRLRWFRHVRRMAKHRIPKRVLEMKISGKKPKGRPRTRWQDKVKRDT